MTKAVETVEVQGWPRPKGYANGTVTRHPTLFVAGQVGWSPGVGFEHKDLVGQFERALANVVAVVRAAGGEPENIASMRVYVTDLDAYRTSLPGIGEAWKKHLGRHFPAMALVGVTGLVEKDAVVEIEAVAALPSRAENPT